MMWISSPNVLQRSFAVVNDLISYFGEAPVKRGAVYYLETLTLCVYGVIIPPEGGESVMSGCGNIICGKLRAGIGIPVFIKCAVFAYNNACAFGNIAVVEAAHKAVDIGCSFHLCYIEAVCAAQIQRKAVRRVLYQLQSDLTGSHSQSILWQHPMKYH